jgi:hypothetical protein
LGVAHIRRRSDFGALPSPPRKPVPVVPVKETRTALSSVPVEKPAVAESPVIAQAAPRLQQPELLAVPAKPSDSSDQPTREPGKRKRKSRDSNQTDPATRMVVIVACVMICFLLLFIWVHFMAKHRPE